MEKICKKSGIAALSAFLICVLATVVCCVVFSGARSTAGAEGQPTASVQLSAEGDFVIDGAGKLTGLSDYGKAKISGGKYFEIVIPANVATLAKACFAGQDKLVKVSFASDSALTLIEDAGVSRPNANNGVFANCTALESVIFPTSLASVDNRVSIGVYAFYNCVSIKRMDIPAYVNNIKGSAFNSCNGLTEVLIDENNEKYTNFRKPDGSLYDSMVYIKDPDTGKPADFSGIRIEVKSVTLPKLVAENTDPLTLEGRFVLNDSYGQVESISAEENSRYRAYGNALYYKENSVDVVENGYFAGDLALAPKHIKVFGIPKEYSYDWDYSEIYEEESYCTELRRMLDGRDQGYFRELESIVVESGNTVFATTNGGGILYNLEKTQILNVPVNIKSAVIPKTTTFTTDVFADTKALESIAVEDGHPQYSAYEGILYNKSLTEVAFVPAAIKNVFIPESVTAIGEGTFEICTKIENVYVYDLKKWCAIDFYCNIVKSDIGGSYPRYKFTTSNPLMSKAYLPSDGNYLSVTSGDLALNNTNLYLRDGGVWSLQTDLIIDFEGEINDVAFAACGSIASVTVSDKITRIGAYAFALCPNLASITVPYVGERKFFETSSVAGHYNSRFSYIYGGDLTSMGNFSRPRNLKSITVDGGNEWQDGDGKLYYGLPASSFDFCPATSYKLNLRTDNAELQNSEPTIGSSAFISAQATKIDLSETPVVNLNSTFALCESLKEIVLPDTLEAIDSQAFTYCTALESIDIPDGVKTIGRQAFSNCSLLTTVRLPSSVESVSGDAFDDCSNLKAVYLECAKLNSGSFGSIAHDYLIIAANEDVYSQLPSVMTEDQSVEAWNINSKTFYIADVKFELKNPSGTVVASTTEKHLASWVEDCAPVLNYAEVTDADGNKYWEQNVDYRLPSVVGEYYVEGEWKLGDQTITENSKLVGVKGAKKQFVATMVSDSVKIVPRDVETVYNGQPWNFESATMEIVGVVAVSGGNGYRYDTYRKVLPTDVGTYKVTATCKTGFKWSDADTNSSPEREFTLEITPVKATLAWYYTYGGEPSRDTLVTGKVPEREYNGKGTRMYMRAEFTDVNGTVQTLDYSAFNLYKAGDRDVIVPLRDAGLYEFTVINSNTAVSGAWLGNYDFENAEQQFRITPYSIDLNDYNNLAWGLPEMSSALRDADLYIYGGKPYMYEQTGMGEAERRTVERSVARFRNRPLSVGITVVPNVLAGDGKQYAANISGQSTESEIGIYTAQATLTVKDGNYRFVYGLDVDLWSRGMKITVNADGTATVQKTWYIVGIDNGMLDASGNEYRIVGWTFGDNVTIPAPRLEHGDELTNYMTNNNVTFELKRNGSSIVRNLMRSGFGEYVNKTMPAGDYELICTIKDVTVGNHTHWWDNEEHNSPDNNSIVYHGFTRTLEFVVAEAPIVFTVEKATDDGYTSYEWKYDAENKQDMFAAFKGMLTRENVKLADVTPTGYWATVSSEYYGGYTVSYNLLRMHNDRYYGADDAALTGSVNKPDAYTVYFNISAPNHAPLTGTGDERYEYCFTVDVYTLLALPTLESASYVYTGERIVPVIETNERYYAEFDENDDYVDAGEHSVTFTVNDAKHYRWTGETGASVAVSFQITKALNEFVEAPDVVRWIEGKFDAEENTFIGVAKFGTICYIITDTDDNVIYDLSQNIDKRAEMKAGTYILKATVAGNDNYSGLSESFTIRILDKVGMPWWGTLLIVLGALAVAAGIILILWKKGVFQILTGKIVLAIRTRANVDATIASVRAAKKTEEGKKSVAEAKRKEAAQARKEKAAAERALPAEARAAALEAKAQAEAERIERIRARMEALKARAERMREESEQEVEQTAAKEAAATETTEQDNPAEK